MSALNITIGVLWSVCLVAAGEPSRNPADAKSQAEVDAILSRLEKRGAGIADIRCRVQFVEDDRINLAKWVKQGRILFRVTEPNPHFLIHFEKTEADGVLGKQEWYLFDGQWLYQGLERVKQVTKQEIAQPGEKVNLFDLEKAPFPLPFGQKKDTILRNFEVSLVPEQSGDPPRSDHLVCIPKPGTRLYKKYDKLELFVLKDVNLPGRIIVTKNNGLEINTADFPDLTAKSINAGISEKDFARPPEWKGYVEVVEKLVPDDAP